MGDTRFLVWKGIIDSWDILVADDEELVTSSFKEHLGCDGVNVTMEEFATLLSDNAAGLRVAVLDGTLYREDDSSAIDGWLGRRELRTDLNRGLLLIGFSGDERNRTDRCFRWYLKGEHPRDAVFSIVQLCRETASDRHTFESWPEKLSNSKSDISSVIHALDNFLIPLRYDAKTLSDCLTSEPSSAPLPETYRAIWADHFGVGGRGYLGEWTQQHRGKEAIGFMNSLIAGLGAGVIQGSSKELKAFNEALAEIRAKNWRQVGGDDFRETAKQLAEDLDAALIRGCELITALRRCRVKPKAETV